MLETFALDISKIRNVFYVFVENKHFVPYIGIDILFVSDSPILKNVFYNSNSLNYIKWKRGGLSKFKEVDLVFLNDFGIENLVEAHRKSVFCLLGLEALRLVVCL